MYTENAVTDTVMRSPVPCQFSLFDTVETREPARTHIAPDCQKRLRPQAATRTIQDRRAEPTGTLTFVDVDDMAGRDSPGKDNREGMRSVEDASSAVQIAGLRASKPTHVGVPSNLQELLDLLEQEPAGCRKETECRSAVRGMGKVLRKPLPNVPTDPVALRPLLKSATPAAHKITTQRWSRIKSLVAFALRQYGIDLQPARDVAGHAPAWKALASLAPDKACALGLSRFMSFCSREGTPPEAVSSQTFDRFREALENRSLQQSPEALYRKSVRCWNRAVEAVAEWPGETVPISRHDRFYSFDWSEFPPTFQEDVEAYLAQSGSDDIFDDNYRDPSKPGTIALRRRELRQLASLLVLSGFPIAEVTDLSVLVKPANANAALKHQQNRTDKKIGSSLGQQAWVLKIVAREWVRDQEAVAALGQLAKRITKRQKIMTDRNTQRLKQFEAEANVEALLGLPANVFKEAGREATVSPALARRVMAALAVDILTVAPMRVGNLTHLDLDRHVLRLGRGATEEWIISIPADETKTDKAFEMHLPKSTAARLKIFLERYRPVLWAGSAPVLFVSPNGKARSITAFSRAISAHIKRECGLIMNAHLFRAFAGKLHLDEYPDDIETVRRLLQHTHSETTNRHYVENRSRRQMERYTDLVEGRRAAAVEAKVRKGGER